MPVHFYRAKKYEEDVVEEELGMKSIKELPQTPTLRIIGYEKEYFLKMETQVYQI